MEARIRSAAFARSALALSALATLVLAGTASAELPRSLTLATHGVGSLYNSIGSGIATVISRNTPMLVRVQPFGGPPAWLPSMDRGDTDMGILTSADAVTSYKGVVLYQRRFPNSRIITVGGPLALSFFVRQDQAMKTVADLKGKRLPADFAGTPIVALSTSAALANAALSYDDVESVPVSSLQSGTQAFIEGRLDAGWHSVGSPAVREADASVGGIRFLSILTTPDGLQRMADVYPGSYPSVIKGGSTVGVETDTTVLTNDIYLVGSAEMSEDAVYEVVKTMWEHNAELGKAYRALNSWSTDRMVSEQAFIPYHPGAIRFFEEKGVWTAEMDALQAKLLDL